MTLRAVALASAVLLAIAAAPAGAWDREPVVTFAVLPDGSGGPEGLEVDPRGNVYVASFGLTATGPVAGVGRIFVYDRTGRLERTLTLADSSVQLLGLRWRESTRTLLAVDFGNKRVLEVNPATGENTVFMTFPVPPESSSPNDIEFDSAGNVYVSDSFQGTIWRTGSDGGQATAWVERAPLLQTTGVPPFGANGLRFNNEGTALFVANTGDDTVVKIPITGGPPGTTGEPGAPVVFVNSINGADGLLVDEEDNLWVAANQADEIVVVDPAGRGIAKLGDFDGVRKGVPRGLLFPASLRFLGNRLLVTNLALNLELFGLAPSVDTAWTKQVTRYTVSALPARLPRDDRDHRGGRDDDGDARDGRGGKHGY
jgi:sugar lactone lactonase YvrE